MTALCCWSADSVTYTVTIILHRLGLIALLVLTAAGCTRRVVVPAREDVDVLIIAPHPDDEVLLAAGVIARTLAEGRKAAVIVVTSGGYTCERNGALRESETVAALQALGMAEKDVHFLGYPDGYLSMLGTQPLFAVERLDPDGQCRLAGTTAATHGFGHLDEHSVRTGKPAP